MVTAQRVDGIPTIYDVAARANVSIATVSRVLNGHGRIRPETEDRVVTAVRELGFVPNAAAQGLSKGLKRILGLVFANTWWQDDQESVEDTNLLFADTVIRGAELRADRHGYSILLLSSGTARRAAGTTFGDFIGKVDGVILLDRVVAQERVGSIAKRVPVVLLAGSGRSRSAVTIRVDNVGGMHELAQHLVADHGLKDLLFVGGFADSPDNVSRSDAFSAGVSKHGGRLATGDVLQADWTSSGAAEALSRRLRTRRRPPQAIACANDQMAIGAIHSVVTAGLRVPEDVAVVGFDDIPVSRFLSPPLTTVRQPMKELGAVAVDSLVRRLQGDRSQRRDQVLPTELVVRGSCGCDPTPAHSNGSFAVKELI